MKKTIISIFLFASVNAFAQNDTITKEDLAKELQPLKTSIQTLQKETKSIKTEIGNLNTKFSIVNKSIDSLRNKIHENSAVISQTANELAGKISTSESHIQQKFTEVSHSLKNNLLYGIIGASLAFLLLVLFYLLLIMKQKTDKTKIFSQIMITKEELEQKSVKNKAEVFNQIATTEKGLNKQLLEVIEKQLKIADTLNTNKPEEVDHTFHKNSANELMRIRNYANTLDPQSQDAIALKASIERSMNYFKSNGYEIIDFTGQDFDERLPIKINDSIFDETLSKGKEIIVKTWKPLIKYKGKTIQNAEVDTKYNN